MLSAPPSQQQYPSKQPQRPVMSESCGGVEYYDKYLQVVQPITKDKGK